MSSGWEDQFVQLKNQFLTRSAERLNQVEELLGELSQSPANEATLKAIMQHFHWLAGSGGTYGFDEVSQWGSYGEELCDYLIKVGGPVSGEHQEKLYGALSTSRQLFAARTGGAPQTGTAHAANQPLMTQIQSPPDQTVPVRQTEEYNVSELRQSQGPPPITHTSEHTVPVTSMSQQPQAAGPTRSALPTAEINLRAAMGAPYAVVVDGDLSTLGTWKQELESRGLYVESFSTAHAALPAICERLPDVLIITVPLPDSLGYELAEQLRSIEGGHRPVIIILGQQAGFLDRVQAIRSGADAFFDYPCDHPEVITKVFYLMDRDKPEQYKILSVEDDPDQAAFIKLTLESAGYRLAQVSDPHAFEEAFLSFEPDLVLLDVMLGDMNGFELAKYIRQYDRFATIPIIFLTTQNKLHMHIKGAKAGGDEHLVKPVATQLLIATIAGRLEKARALKRLIDRDGLTRCLTFGTFMERSQKLVSSEGWRSAPALMMLDVDNMKTLNDQYGFAAGDKVISNVGSLLLKGFRNTDMIARYQSDRFAVLIEHLNEQQLNNLASQVVAAIATAQHAVGGGALSITCSAGLAILEEGMNLAQWIENADKALKVAKQQGKNRAVVKPVVRAAR